MPVSPFTIGMHWFTWFLVGPVNGSGYPWLQFYEFTWLSSVPDVSNMSCNLCFGDYQPFSTHKKQIVIKI
jgi:hypothetical protein